MTPQVPSPHNVHALLTCLPSERGEGIKDDISVAKCQPGKEEHAVNCPRRPICNSLGHCLWSRSRHFQPQLDALFNLESPHAESLKRLLPPPTSTAYGSLDSQQVPHTLLLSQGGPPSQSPQPSCYSLITSSLALSAFLLNSTSGRGGRGSLLLPKQTPPRGPRLTFNLSIDPVPPSVAIYQPSQVSRV